MAYRKPKRKVPGTKELSGPSEDNSLKIVPVLEGYLAEAQDARRGGLNPRDDKWEENLHLYWNRYDHSRKADWQAQETMPEVPTFVDRFAAACKEALVASPNGFYDVIDPADQEGDITNAIKRATDVWLSTTGRNQTGTALAFPAVFEEQVKMGALMSCSAVVLWKNDIGKGRVAIETVDPRMVWLDPTYRNLYRIRRTEIDKHELRKMAMARDAKGRPIYNLDAVNQMVAHVEMEDQRRREELTGSGQQVTSTRQPVTLDEYIATVVDNSGNVLAEDALMVVGNRQFLVRGPEKNPYWHRKDWLVNAPLVTAPLSVYGRSYMEDFGSVAKTFNNLTNMLLDAAYTSSLKAFAVVPAMLLDPSQLSGGITPNKAFLLDEGFRAEDFMKAIDLGVLPPEAISIWQAIKSELREAADINEVGLGQFAPKSRTSATEISSAQESSSALIRSIAQTLEMRFLNPVLDLVWMTGLQHVAPNDPMISAAMGPELFKAIYARRKELISRDVTFQARGISTLIQKNRMLKSLLFLMQTLAQSDMLLQEFLKVADLQKLVKLLFELSDIDLSKLEISQRDRLIAGVSQPIMQAGADAAARTPGGGAGNPNTGQMQQVVQSMGLAR